MSWVVDEADKYRKTPQCDRCRLIKPSKGPLRLNKGWWHVTPHGLISSRSADLHFCPNCAAAFFVGLDITLTTEVTVAGPEARETKTLFRPTYPLAETTVRAAVKELEERARVGTNYEPLFEPSATMSLAEVRTTFKTVKVVLDALKVRTDELAATKNEVRILKAQLTRKKTE